MTEINECPICGSIEFKEYLNVKDHSISKESFSIKQCKKCGLRLSSPRPDDKDLPKYYESEDYVSHSDTKKGLINNLYHTVKQITIKQKEALIDSISSGKDLLDIGCGTGDFLLYCKGKGWEVSGLEPDPNARKRAKEKGLIEVEDLPQFYELKADSYDVISMWHVLEHVADLNEYFKQLRLLLKENGHLVIAVPNPDSPDAIKYKEYWAALDVPRHLFHFSKQNIKDLAAKHQFKLDSIKPMLFDSFYVSMLSEKYKGGNILNAAINGFFSNIKARKTKNHSSLIYILSKKTK